MMRAALLCALLLCGCLHQTPTAPKAPTATGLASHYQIDQALTDYANKVKTRDIAVEVGRWVDPDRWPYFLIADVGAGDVPRVWVVALDDDVEGSQSVLDQLAAEGKL